MSNEFQLELEADNGQDNRVRSNSSPLKTRLIEHSGSSVCYVVNELLRRCVA